MQITILILIIIQLISQFLLTYIKKKGENQATKEDIGKITFIVEGIRKELADNTEILKSDLSLKNEHLISLRVMERDSLVNYYKQIFGLITYLKRLDFTRFDVKNYNDIDLLNIKVEDEFSKLDLAEAHAELFF